MACLACDLLQGCTRSIPSSQLRDHLGISELAGWLSRQRQQMTNDAPIQAGRFHNRLDRGTLSITVAHDPDGVFKVSSDTLRPIRPNSGFGQQPANQGWPPA
jgi:hypothetical protein